MLELANDPVALTQALVRCASVTPEEGGALTLIQSVLEPAGFTCHRLTMTEPGTPDVENLYARIGTSTWLHSRHKKRPPGRSTR